MTEIDDLKAKIGELEEDVKGKENEIIKQLDRIEHLEEEIMRFESIISDKEGNATNDSKLAIHLDDKDRQIRELKDKMGYLRKEKIQLQQELEKIIKEKNEISSSQVSQETSSTPLDSLVGDLQSKINKQRLLITKLKQQAMGADLAELNEKVRKKDEEIKKLKEQLEHSAQKVTDVKDISKGPGPDKIMQNLTEELQSKLNKAKQTIEELKNELNQQGKKGKKKGKETKNTETDKLQDMIKELEKVNQNKDVEIKQLKETVSNLKQQPSEGAKASSTPSVPIAGLTEELQTKLNKARVQLKEYQEKIKSLESGKVTPSKSPKKGKDKIQDRIEELEEELRNKDVEIKQLKETVSNLKQQPSEGAKASSTPSVPIAGLTEELQTKLNKARAQLKEYQEKIKSLESGKPAITTPPPRDQGKLQEEISKQQELINQLQDQILEQSEEFGGIQQSATQLKIKCEGLETEVEIKEEKIKELKEKLLGVESGLQTKAVQAEQPEPVALRLRELSSMIDELEKQNIQQRFEINQLKNSV